MPTLPQTAAGAIGIALIAYVLLGGADFGGGVWDALASGPRQAAQREIIAHAIGPIWEANHVWLIAAIVTLFTCFPAAFALVMTTLHIPVTLVLIGIVMRGSAFAFRSYYGTDAGQAPWARTFAVASVITPLVIGMIAGAVTSGRVLPPPVEGQTFASVYLAPWLTPFAFAVGAFALALFAFLAAVYLTVEAAHDRELQEDFRRRALWAAAMVFATAAVSLALVHSAVPPLRAGLLSSPHAAILHVITALAAVTAVVGLWRRTYRLARGAAAAQVALILVGWMAAEYPYLVPPTLTVPGSAAPAETLRLTLIALGAGALILVPSLAYLFRIFKGGGLPR